MPDNHALRREYVLDQAIAAGKFGPTRRAFWSGQYDRNPAGTEQTLAALASTTDGTPPYPRELFPELVKPRSRRERTATQAAVAAAPPPPTAPEPAGDAADEQVAGWTRQMFPETAAVGAGSRVTRAND